MFVFVEFHVIYFDGINMRGRNQRRKEKVGSFVGYGCFVLLCNYRWAFIDFHWINDKFERENHPGSYSATQTTWLNTWNIPVKNTPVLLEKNEINLGGFLLPGDSFFILQIYPRSHFFPQRGTWCAKDFFKESKIDENLLFWVAHWIE